MTKIKNTDTAVSRDRQRIARAVIKAMRKPTHEMTDAKLERKAKQLYRALYDEPWERADAAVRKRHLETAKRGLEITDAF